MGFDQMEASLLISLKCCSHKNWLLNRIYALHRQESVLHLKCTVCCVFCIIAGANCLCVRQWKPSPPTSDRVPNTSLKNDWHQLFIVRNCKTLCKSKFVTDLQQLQNNFGMETAHGTFPASACLKTWPHASRRAPTQHSWCLKRPA